MAPSEDDNAPKAPDKSDKSKCENSQVVDNTKENDKDEKSLSNLNDGELKALLDEAMNYKNPKDREGKSKLFKDLLHQAEETERIARAASAGGSELVRHCNPSARGAGGRGRRSAGGGARLSGGCTGGGPRTGGVGGGAIGKRASAAERHGGSLDDLAKEELYVRSAARQLVGAAGGRQAQQPRRTVSARQWEGGSLPCDVNSSVPARDCQFLEEARKSKALKNKEYTSIDIDSLESQSLLDHDVLAQNYQEAQQEVTIAPRYTSRATLQISATPVDDPIPLDLETAVDKKPYDLESLQNKVLHSKYSVYIPTYPKTEDKKVDENGNALHQSSSAKAKKKKIQADKNVVVLAAEKVEGHRGDIIHDVDKLIQYIAGDKEEKDSGKANRYNVHKSKQLHKQHTSEEGPRSKKQRAHSKGKESRSELKKSNSLGEISTAKLDDFAFSSRDEKDEDKVVLRPNKNQSDRPKERRSWGNVEPPPFQILSNSASIENLETSDNWVVTKPKKKNKKRRNSISSNRRQNSTSDSFAKQHINRAPSPDLRGKSACSVPHSERSNDSSDADSVHSLPIDGLNHQISYADIAKNREKKLSPEKQEKIGGGSGKEKAVTLATTRVECDAKFAAAQTTTKKAAVEKQLVLAPVINNVKVDPVLAPVTTSVKQPPDMNNPRAFPAIPSDLKPPPDVHSPKAFPAIAEPPKNCAQQLSPPASCCDPPKGGGGSPAVSPPSLASPPDFSNPKSFPAISSSGSSTKSSSSTGSSGSTIGGSSAKTKNAYPSTAVRVGGVPTATTTVRSALNIDVDKGAMSVSTCVVQCDIQNDLSIIHWNEKDSIQHNAQMLPANIPDVRTIEQMHFMHRGAAPVSVPPLVELQHHHQQMSPPRAIVASPPVVAPSQQQPRRQQPTPHQHHNHCDSERPMTIPGSQLSAESEEGMENSSSRGRPPVVIMSGGAAAGNKEVPGLVFGFDINEQLLHEDACESFIARWVAPETYSFHSHNHDKIVNFIGSAWEAIVNQSNGKVQYYKEES